MSNQNQAATTEQPQQVEVRVGFEAALDNFDAAWKETWDQARIDQARFFYHAAIRDTSFFVNNAVYNIGEGYKWLNDALQLPQVGGTPAPVAGDATPASEDGAEVTTQPDSSKDA